MCGMLCLPHSECRDLWDERMPKSNDCAMHRSRSHFSSQDGEGAIWSTRKVQNLGKSSGITSWRAEMCCGALGAIGQLSRTRSRCSHWTYFRCNGMMWRRLIAWPPRGDGGTRCASWANTSWRGLSMSWCCVEASARIAITTMFGTFALTALTLGPLTSHQFLFNSCPSMEPTIHWCMMLFRRRSTCLGANAVLAAPTSIPTVSWTISEQNEKASHDSWLII